MRNIVPELPVDEAKPRKSALPELCQLGELGAGVIIDASTLTIAELTDLAGATCGLVILKNIVDLTMAECRQIAEIGKQRIIFDFTSNSPLLRVPE